MGYWRHGSKAKFFVPSGPEQFKSRATKATKDIEMRMASNSASPFIVSQLEGALVRSSAGDHPKLRAVKRRDKLTKSANEARHRQRI